MARKNVLQAAYVPLVGLRVVRPDEEAPIDGAGR